MRQLYRAHVALFVCAYVGFLGYHAVTDPDDPVAALLRARADANDGPQPHAAAPAPSSAVRGIGASEDPRPSVTAAAESSTPVADDATQEQERARLDEMRLQATNAEEPQRRAEAIDQLNVATPETLRALQTVVTSDSAVRNRIRALNSLRAIAEREGATDAVISIVHLAMVDTNASVASRANEVYRELTQEQSPGE